MIAQSLGGMEIVVGMSSLTGGLVLDKKQTDPGKRTPHQLPVEQVQVYSIYYTVL